MYSFFTAFAYDSDELNSWYYDWYDGDDYESSEYAAEETKDNDFKFRITASDKQYDMRDYPAEDNRSEINDESLENVGNDTYLNSEKNISKKHQVEHLTSKEVENLGIIDLTAQSKSDSDLQVLNSPNEVGEDHLNKKIFEDTKAILHEETKNNYSQDFAIVGTNTEKTVAPTEVIEETRRLLNEISDNMEEENIKKDGALLLDNDENIHNDKQKTTEADIEDHESEAIEKFQTDLKKLQEIWSNLNELDDNIFDLDDVSNSTSINKSKTDDRITPDDKNKEQQIESIGEVSSDSSQIDKITKTSPSFLYLDDALLATESDTTISDKPDNFLKEEKTNTRDDELDSKKIISSKIGDEVEHKEGDVTDLSSDNQISEITKNDIRDAFRIWLAVDSPTVITSPGFPNPYPTNTTIDWMISGDGMGIEMNITDFAINGHVGDYLLIKPGKNNCHSTQYLFIFNVHYKYY